MIAVSKILIVLALVSGVYPATASTLTITAIASGFCSDSNGSFCTGPNTNYIAGSFPMGAPTKEYRDFFVFDLAAVQGKIIDARLDIWKPSFDMSPNLTDVFAVFDVTTDVSTLISVPPGSLGHFDIFSDLGTGTVYGSTTYIPSESNVIVSLNLNTSAVSAMNSVGGGLFAVGGAVQNVVSGDFQYIFGDTRGPADVKLTLTTTADVPEPRSSALVAAGCLMMIGLKSRCRPKMRIGNWAKRWFLTSSES